MAERAGMALLSGDAATAREAYRRLLPALVEAIKQVTYIGGRARLAMLEAIRRESLQDLDWALPELIEILRECPAGFGFGAQARDLLAEATERHRGVDGPTIWHEHGDLSKRKRTATGSMR